jgi:hypothetical protein
MKNKINARRYYTAWQKDQKWWKFRIKELLEVLSSVPGVQQGE